MENWLTDIMNEFGYMGVMFLIALENLFPPIPSEVILTFSGFTTTTTDLTIFGVIFAATGGSVIGAIILYIVGLQLDVARLEKLVNKYGHILRLKVEDVHKADAWFDKYGPWTVFFCRFVPVIRSLISIPAGMSNMNIGVFLVFTTLGTLIWNIVLVYLGASVGESWDAIVNYMDIYSNIIYGILVICIIVLVVVFVKKRR